MTSSQFHIFCSPSHTNIDEGPKLHIHNLIHAIKRFHSDTFSQPHCVAIVAHRWLLVTRSRLRLQNLYTHSY